MCFLQIQIEKLASVPLQLVSFVWSFTGTGTDTGSGYYCSSVFCSAFLFGLQKYSIRSQHCFRSLAYRLRSRVISKAVCVQCACVCTVTVLAVRRGEGARCAAGLFLSPVELPGAPPVVPRPVKEPPLGRG